MNAKKNIFVVLMVGVSVIAQLLNPMSARADGETPPAPAETVEATEPPVSVAVPTKAPLVETPVVSDTPTAEPVLITEVPAIESPTPNSTEVTEQPTMLEAIQDVSDKTSLVVLDENGQPIPLGTEEATDILVTGDPVWCPNSTTPGGSGCTSSYTSLASLLSYLSAQNGGTGINSNGTIWIESSYNSSINDPLSTGFALDGGTLTTWAHYALTLQGGWGGGSNSVFTVPISILNWLNTVTVNNITINNSSNGGLHVNMANPNASVNINNVTVRGAHGFGVVVETYGGAVTIQNSTFRDTVADSAYLSYGDGADIFSNGGNVTISNSRFINNEPSGGGYGAWISAGSTGNLIIDNSEFSSNTIGLSAFSSNDIYILNGNVFQNNSNGLSYSDCNGSLFLDPGVMFLGNFVDISNWGGGCSDPIPYEGPLTGLGLSTQQSGKFALECENRGGFSVPLPNGDLVQIFCPVSGIAEIARLDNTILPANLPDGYTFASAFELQIIQSDKPIIAINDLGYIRASFIAPNLEAAGNPYSILYWDPKKQDWVVLKDYMRDGNSSRQFYLDPENTTDTARRKIISGVQLVTEHKDNRVEVSTNFPGIFVLAQH